MLRYCQTGLVLLRGLAFWLPILILALAALVNADDTDYTQLCRLFPAGTSLRMPGSCEKYIECDGIEGTVFSCMTPKAFDAQQQSCVETYASTDLCGNRCEKKNAIWVADPTNCHGYFYCSEGEALQGYCQGDLHFDEGSQMCVYSDSSSCIDVSSMCEVVPDKMKFRDETDCSYYYQCSKQVQSRVKCKSKFFDVNSQDCVDYDKVACNAHPIPAGICTVSKNPYIGMKADEATCRGYFYCANLGAVADLEPTWYQCPAGKFFSEADQACLDPKDVKCDYNRCDGRGNRMVSSGNNNCHNYLICEDGYVKEEKTCAKYYFFNEDYQACVPDIIYYEACDE